MSRPRPKEHGQLLRYAPTVGVRHEKVAEAIDRLEVLKGKHRQACTALDQARDAVEHAKRADLDAHASAIAESRPKSKPTAPKAEEVLRDAEATEHATRIAVERAEVDIVRLVDVHRDALWTEAEDERDAAEVEASTALSELESALEARLAALRKLYWLKYGKALVPPEPITVDAASPTAILDELRRLFTVRIGRPDSVARTVTSSTVPVDPEPETVSVDPEPETVSIA